MLIMHISISDNISIIHNSNNIIERGTIPRGTNPNSHVYGNSPVTIYTKGTIPTGTIPRGTSHNDPLTSTAMSELL